MTYLRRLLPKNHQSGIGWISFFWLLIIAPMPFCQKAPPPTFEKLCQSYLQSPDFSARNALIVFCEKNKGSQLAGLGYFLIAFTEHKNDKFEIAVSNFEKAASNRVPIEDYVEYYWAKSLYNLNQLKRSQEKLASFVANFPSSPFREKALLLYWEISLSLNEPQTVVDSLKSEAGSDAPDALYYLAQAKESLGQLKEALQNYQRLYYFFPLYRQSSIISEKIPTLQNMLGFKSEVPFVWKVVRIEKLYSSKRSRETLEDLEMLFKSNPSSRASPQFQRWRGISEFGAGNYEAAIQILKGLKPSGPEARAEAWFYIAESYRKLENYFSFKQSVEILGQQFPKSRWLEEALYSIANYNLVKRDLKESATYCQKIVDLFPNGRYVMDCHWRVSWQCYRNKDYRRAFHLFMKHLTHFEDSNHRAAALYWAARCKVNLGQPEDAYQIYSAILQKFFDNYYGQLARSQMASLKSQSRANQTNKDARLVKILDDLKGPVESANQVNVSQLQNSSFELWPRVHALAQIQLFELAAEELLCSPISADSSALYFQVAQLFYKGKNFFSTISHLRKVWPDYRQMPFRAIPESVWKMFFPVEFTPSLLLEARSRNLDPYLMMALIRQESTFNPKALSKANAHGLMQLLPATAQAVARQMNLRPPAADRLYDSDLNIRLGTKHFANLLRKFNGQEDKALASYNAGADRVESWMNEGSFEDSAEFVETIPLSETRNYVKSIYRNYWFYRNLYGDCISTLSTEEDPRPLASLIGQVRRLFD